MSDIWKSLEKVAIKIWFTFNFAKNLKNHHFVVGGLKNLKLLTDTCFGISFQKNVLCIFLLFSSACYQDDLSDSERNEIASSAVCNLSNSRLLYVKCSGTINLC